MNRAILNPSEPIAERPIAAAGELLALARTLKACGANPHEATLELANESAWLNAIPLALLRDADVLERRAFWINIYNALVVHGLLAGEPRAPTTSLGRLRWFRKVSYRVAGVRLSLDQIEHGILRGNRGHPVRLGFPELMPWSRCRAWVLPLDPRIHFALNCGARSCPPIRCYRGPELNEQLDMAARSFLQEGIRYDSETGLLSCSKLLRWYQGDFGNSWSARLSYLASFVEPDLAARLSEDPEIAWQEYHWSLA